MRDIKFIEKDRDRMLKDLGKLTYATMRLIEQMNANEKKAANLRGCLDAIRQEMINLQTEQVDENTFPEKAP